MDLKPCAPRTVPPTFKDTSNYLSLSVPCCAVLRRATCNEVMRVLRTNKDSVMAMLEAFVHDPLINWRLLNTAETSVTDAITRCASKGLSRQVVGRQGALQPLRHRGGGAANCWNLVGGPGGLRC